jgi:alkaline phosphatase
MARLRPARLFERTCTARLRGARFDLALIYLALVTITVPATVYAQGPRNVILIVGDGMDDHQITIARNYLKGARGRLLLDSMPVRSVAQVLTVSNEDPGSAVYVADSANTATSLATGIITSRGRLATTPGSDRDVTTIIELAEAAGFQTGIVSTASVTDATPAAFVAHISQRFCENPAAMEDIVYRGIHIGDCTPDQKRNGGLGSIAEQIAASGVDVVLGGGTRHFAENGEGEERSVLEAALANGYHVMTVASDLDNPPANKKLLGLFSSGTMPVRWQGEGGRSAEKPQPSFMNYVYRYLGTVRLPEPMTCEANPESSNVPSLKQMTEAALAHLTREKSAGFFLIVESASIDKQAHARSACGSIGELEQLEEALQSALAFAQREPDTLVLVTSDHGHAAQVVPNESLFKAFGVPIFTPGHLVRLKTFDGQVLAVNYATNDFKLEEHTGVNVPLFANAVGQGRVPSMVTQPEIFEIMVDYLGLNDGSKNARASGVASN